MFSDTEAEERDLLKANIWKIDRFALHDGPGIRTNLYFKGCPLRCLWCSNPEGQLRENQLSWIEDKCSGLGLCAKSCPEGAIKFDGTKPEANPDKCKFCGQCASACPNGAWRPYGRFYTLAEVMRILEKSRHISRKSGGGVTLSGGEPLVQGEFVQALLERCKRSGISTCLETCGYVDEGLFLRILPNVNWLFIDLKHMDSERHRALTGKDNALILHNVKEASSAFAKNGGALVMRLVIVPGLNDGENVKAAAEFAGKLPRVDMVELLPYHSYGSPKYAALRRAYQLDALSPPSRDELERYKDIIEGAGVRCQIGGL